MHENLQSPLKSPACLDGPIPGDWKTELLHSYTSLIELGRDGLIDLRSIESLDSITKNYKLRVTPYYAKLITNLPECPIRRQALASTQEHDPILPEWATHWSQLIYSRSVPWHSDAIGDVEKLGAPRLTHRYSHRAILHLSSMCAVYCRFCFRKGHLNDQDRTLYEGNLDPAFAYLESHSEIREVILTGGDPLSVTDAVLERVFQRLGAFSHIQSVRIHSRMAVTLPSRFDDSLLELLQKPWPFQITLVSHFNHPKELTPYAKLTLKKLKRTGITLLNQSVLMKGINASCEVLFDLFQSLYETGVIPYYLHHPDWTPGTFHFRLSIEEGQALMSRLRGLLSGPALPDYILDLPQGAGKVSLLSPSVRKLQTLGNPKEIQGALYEIIPPATKEQTQNSNQLYLDLYSMPSQETDQSGIYERNPHQ